MASSTIHYVPSIPLFLVDGWCKMQTEGFNEWVGCGRIKPSNGHLTKD